MKTPSREKEEKYVLGLDISTKTIGIALYRDEGEYGELKLLHHITPIAKPKTMSKTEQLFVKSKIFREEFLDEYKNFNITDIIIEEPLLRSNNAHTAGVLLRFNGMLARDAYDAFGIVPEFISSYDARKYAYPQLFTKRTINCKGEPLTESKIEKNKPVLFGGYPCDVDKKQVLFDLFNEEEDNVKWIYATKGKNVGQLKSVNYDMVDAAVALFGYMNMTDRWKR